MEQEGDQFLWFECSDPTQPQHLTSNIRTKHSSELQRGSVTACTRSNHGYDKHQPWPVGPPTSTRPKWICCGTHFLQALVRTILQIFDWYILWRLIKAGDRALFSYNFSLKILLFWNLINLLHDFTTLAKHFRLEMSWSLLILFLFKNSFQWFQCF